VIGVAPTLVSEIVAGSAVQIEIVKVGENILVLGVVVHSIGEIAGNTPPLENISRVEVQELGIGIGPVDSASRLVNQASCSLNKIVEETVVISNVVKLHEKVDGNSIPATSKDFITSEMEGVPREIVLEIGVDVGKQVVGSIEGGVKLTERNASIPNGLGAGDEVREFGIQSPRASVGRSINFRNDLDTSQDGVVDDFLNIALRVGFFGREGSELTELGVAGHVHGERVTISNVPMENVELDGKHGIHHLEELFLGDEMSGSINHDTSVGESRLISDANGGKRNFDDNASVGLSGVFQ
jgi:hypothetical protein